MPKRSSKKRKPGRRDANQLAADIVSKATEDEAEGTSDGADEGKNPAAVELGRRGGKKGGPARAEALTAEERSEIARKAAKARWKKKGRRKQGD